MLGKILFGPVISFVIGFLLSPGNINAIQSIKIKAAHAAGGLMVSYWIALLVCGVFLLIKKHFFGKSNSMNFYLAISGYFSLIITMIAHIGSSLI